MCSKEVYNAPIQFFNRYSGEVETEAIYGERFLRWTYGNPFGKLSVALAVKRLWFSRWYGQRMNHTRSRAKIEPFIRNYGVDTKEFLDPVERLNTFNQFFYRKLKLGARPIVRDKSVAVFPADGRHLAIADVSAADTFYIKGQRFNLKCFLHSETLADEFQNGSLLISRLCPVDYHRFHFPVQGTPGKSTVLGSELRSVSPLALRRKLSILWENRRALTEMNSTRFEKVLVVEIGATCVGGIHQTYTPDTKVQKGDEKGYFSFGGSCVATLYKKGTIRFDEDLLEHSAVGREVYAKMGDSCGRMEI